MSSSFSHIFSLTVAHTYFNNNVCSCLSIRPSISTKEIMSRFGYMLIKDQNVYKLYRKSTISIDESLKYVQKVSTQGCFEFEITTGISNFNIITDFPLDWNGSIPYDTGSDSNILKDGKMEISPDFGAKISSSSTAHLTIRFKDIIKLYQEYAGADFTIKFNARSTRWNYYIINRNSAQLDNPKIAGKTEVQFEGPISTSLENGQTALKFTSGENMLPLSEVPFYKFNLINENINNNNVMKQSSGKVVLAGLPNPNPNKIEIEKTASDSIAASEMYVYV